MEIFLHIVVFWFADIHVSEKYASSIFRLELYALIILHNIQGWGHSYPGKEGRR
jgi:hypothetical protein